MKKLLFCLTGLLLMGTIAFSQPVHDNAVVPIGVTLNQILRLNILTGGNIEFVFTNIDQYEVGITGANYTTTFNVAASQDWDMEWDTDDASLIGDIGIAASNIELSNVGMYIECTGTHTTGGAAGASNMSIPFSSAGTVGDLSNGGEEIIDASTDHNGGDAQDNSFTIHWYCGTGTVDMTQVSFIDQDYEPGRYSTNVLFSIKNHD